jgi:hypothetical protein
MGKINISIFGIASLMFLCACSNSNNVQQVGGPSGPWAIHTPYSWAHDGNPVNTTHFTIYSDSASYNEREKISRGLEKFLQNLNELLDINEEEAQWYPSKDDPFTIFLNKTHLEVPFGFAYSRGMIVVSPDSKFFFNPVPGHYGKLVTHELVHAIDMAITADALVRPPVWFREGFAQLCSGLSGDNEINNIEDLEIIIKELNINKKEWTPLSIQLYPDYPKSVIKDKQEGVYYPLFELAVKYLTTEQNTGKNITDLIGFLERISITNTFGEEFNRTFGFSVDTFNDEFYIRITDWLRSKPIHNK